MRYMLGRGLVPNLLHKILIIECFPIAHCRNVRALGRVSSTEMLMNEKLPNQV